MIRSDENKKKENDMIELTCKVCDDETMMCDEGVVAVTCSTCVNETIMGMNNLEVAA